MPSQSRFSGFGKRQTSKPKAIPLFNPKPQYDPASAIIAANAMVAQVLKMLHDILKGPMAKPCPQYLRSYVQTAAKTLVDLQTQFTNRMPGASDLDIVRVAASSLLNAAAEGDEDEIAEAIASVLHASAESYPPEMLTTVLSASSDWTSVRGIDVIVVDDKIAISGTVERDCNQGCTVEMEFNTSVPLASANLKIKSVN